MSTALHRVLGSLLFLLAWLVAAGPLHAQLLVSNLAEPERSFNQIDSISWIAQGFETDAQHYELTNLTAIVGDESGSSEALAELRSALPGGEMDTSPLGLVALLVAPDLSGPRSARSFIPLSPVELEASTRYYLMLGATGAGSYAVSYAEGNGQVGPGALSQYQYSFDGGSVWDTFGSENPFRLQVDVAAVEPTVLVSNLAEPERSNNTLDGLLLVAQSFETDAQDYQLADISAIVGDESGASGGFGELRRALPSGDMDTSPSGLLSTLALSDLSGPRSPRRITPLVAGIQLQANTRYYVLLSAAPLAGSFDWSYAEGNGQIGLGTLAQYQYSFDGGGVWSDFGTENPMHLEVRTVPEPALPLMLVSGLAGMLVLASRRRRRSSATPHQAVAPSLRRSSGRRVEAPACGTRRTERLGSILAIPFVLLGSHAALADSTFCHLNYAPGTAGFPIAIASGIWLCADSGTGGAASDWARTVGQVDSAAPGIVHAAESGSAGGVFAAAATASSLARPARLTALAYAESIAPFPNDGFSFATANAAADATLLELGFLEAVGGAAPGDPVTLHLTIDVSGSFGGVGAGDGELTIYRNGLIRFQAGAIFLTRFGPSHFFETDLAGFAVGDEVVVWMKLRASAGASNRIGGPTLSTASIDDAEQVFLDVPSNNALFVSTSGHDYRSVPEPDVAGALGVGLAFVSSRVRRSRHVRTCRSTEEACTRVRHEIS